MKQALRSVKYPQQIRFEVTALCNFRCRHCYLGSGYWKMKDLQLEDLKNIIYKLTKRPVKILFLGGEPFMRSDIFELLEYAKRRGANVGIDTNGWLLNEKMVKKLKKIGVNFNISFYGASARMHDYFTCLGSFERVMKVLEMCKKEKLNTHISFLLSRMNFADLFKVYAIAREFGVSKIHLDPFTARGRGSDYRSEFQLSTPQFLFFWGFIRPFYLKTFKESEVVPTPCNIKTCPTVKPNGDVWPCVHYGSSIGNLLKEDEEDIWRRLQSFHLADEVCAHCIGNKLDNIGRKIMFSNKAMTRLYMKLHRVLPRLWR